MDFNKRLKELRVEKKLTQMDIAKILNVKPTAISNYESGRNEPSYDKLKILATYYGVTLDYLLGESDDNFSENKKDINKDVNEFSSLYNELSKNGKSEIKDFAEWLIHKQK